MLTPTGALLVVVASCGGGRAEPRATLTPPPTPPPPALADAGPSQDSSISTAVQTQPKTAVAPTFGDACGGADAGPVCAKTGRQALICRDGKMALYLQCRGPQACLPTDEGLHCDNTVAELGDPCTKPGNYACSVDARAMFQCQEGQWRHWRHCRGRDGCQVKETEVACDVSYAERDDPCGIPGGLACSLDGTLQLICHEGTWKKDRVCPRVRCKITGTKHIECQ